MKIITNKVDRQLACIYVKTNENSTSITVHQVAEDLNNLRLQEVANAITFSNSRGKTNSHEPHPHVHNRTFENKGFSINFSANDKYYETLQLSHTASSMEIKTAYKKLALIYHPDKIKKREQETQEGFLGRQIENEEIFKRINAARKALLPS